MRLLFLTTHPIQYNAPLFSYLVKQSNYSIKVFYTLGDNTNSPAHNGFGVKENWNIDLLSGYDYEFIENTSSSPSSLTYLGTKNPSLINRIKAYNPDAMIIYGWKHHSHLSALNHFRKKIPILFRGDSTTLDDFSDSSLRSYLRYTLLKWVYKKVDYVLSPGAASDQYFLKSGIRQHQIIRAEHAIDNERFMNMTKIEEEQLCKLRTSLSLKSDEIVFLFAGKFIHKKNPVLLIDTFAQLKEINDNVRLLLAGDGILNDEINKRINELHLNIAKSINVLSFQDQQQMKLLYRVSDVFVLPSKSETWGLSINESLASGTPVIVSNKCGSSHDLVKHGVNGLVFQSENSQDLLDKMIQICDHQFRERLAASTKESIKNYSYQSFKTALDKIFKVNAD